MLAILAALNLVVGLHTICRGMLPWSRIKLLR